MGDLLLARVPEVYRRFMLLSHLLGVPLLPASFNDWMAGKVHHYAHHGLIIGEIGRVTRCLSNLIHFINGKSGTTLRRVALSLTHLRRLEGSTRLIPSYYSQG